jgi:hypothetical protein
MTFTMTLSDQGPYAAAELLGIMPRLRGFSSPYPGVDTRIGSGGRRDDQGFANVDTSPAAQCSGGHDAVHTASSTATDAPRTALRRHPPRSPRISVRVPPDGVGQGAADPIVFTDM